MCEWRNKVSFDHYSWGQKHMSNIFYTTIHMHYYYSKINSGTASLWRVCYCVSNYLPLARWIEQISGAIVVHCSMWHSSMQPPQWLAIMVITWQQLNMTQKESCTFYLAFKWLTFLFKKKLLLVQLEFQAGSSSGSTVVADEQDIQLVLFPGLILFQPCSLACSRRSVVAQVVYSQPKDSHTNSKKAPSTVCLSLRIKSPAWMILLCACAIVFGAYSKLIMCRVHTGCYLIGCTAQCFGAGGKLSSKIRYHK